MFIRDAEESNYAPIRDPTGWAMVDAGRAGTRSGAEPLLDYDHSGGSSPASSPGSSSPRLGLGDDQTTPRARHIKRTFSGGSYTRKGTGASTSIGSLFTNGPLNEEPSEGDTPKQKDIATFPSTTSISPSASATTFTSGSSKPTASSGYITTPPPPVQPLIIPSSSSQLSSSLSRQPPGRMRAQRSATDTYTQTNRGQPYINGYANDETGHSRPRTNTVRSSTSSLPSIPLSYTKPSRLSFLALGGTTTGRRTSPNVDQISNPNLSGSPRSGGSSGSSGSSGTTTTTSSTNGGRSESEKKRGELQNRVYTARTQMPSRVLLRVFRHPEECGEDVDRVFLLS